MYPEISIIPETLPFFFFLICLICAAADAEGVGGSRILCSHHPAGGLVLQRALTFAIHVLFACTVPTALIKELILMM